MSDLEARSERPKRIPDQCTELMLQDSVQVNIPAESGEMGILANHVPAIEQLKPGLVEIIEEAGASKQFFRTSNPVYP
jgi:F0F1-type ATP synthase epsilon subunit